MSSPWYRTGTVAVTNADPNIVGTGTYWRTIGVLKGDLFLGPDLNFYEITADATAEDALSVKALDGTAAYQGTTLSGQAYAIIRNFTNTTNADLATRISNLIQSWQGREDEMIDWLAGASDGGSTLPAGTCVLTDANGIDYIGTEATESACTSASGTWYATETALTDGRFLMTDVLGTQKLVKSPARIQYDHEQYLPALAGASDTGKTLAVNAAGDGYDLKTAAEQRTNLDVFGKTDLTGAITATTDGIDAIFISPETVYRTFPQLRYRRSGVRTFVDGYGKLRTADYATGTADASSTPGQLVDTKSWALGHWAYAMIYIVSGTGAGQYRWCVANSATALMPDRPFDEIDGDSVYEVMQLPVSWGWHSAGAGTNLLTHSGDLTHADWGVPAANWTATTSVAVAAPLSDPDVSVTQLVATATPASRFARQTKTFGAGDRTASLYVYVPSGQGIAQWNVIADWQDTEEAGPGAQTTFDAWVRVEGSATLAASRSWLDFRIFCDGINPSAGFTFYATLGQDETGTFASPPIITTTASAARARDQISFELHGIVYNSFSILTDYEVDGFLALNTGALVTDNSLVGGTGQLSFRFHGGAEFTDAVKVGDVTIYPTGTPVANQRYRDVVTYDGATAAAYRDGESTGTAATSTALDVHSSATGRLMSSDGGTDNLPGRLYRFRIVPGALTAAQARIW